MKRMTGGRVMGPSFVWEAEYRSGDLRLKEVDREEILAN